MSRFRLVLLSMLAVFAFAAVASASASAYEYIVPCHPVLAANIAKSRWEDAACTKPKAAGGFDTRLFPGEVAKVTGTSGVSTLSATISGVTLTITCNKDKFAGSLGANGSSSHTVITYEECEVTGSFGPKCEVPKTLETQNLEDQLNSSGWIEDTFKPEGGTEFIELPVTAKSGQKCSVASDYKVTGSQTCEVDKSKADESNAEAETLQEGHAIICKPDETLKLGIYTANYTGTANVKLEGGGNWAIE